MTSRRPTRRTLAAGAAIVVAAAAVAGAWSWMRRHRLPSSDSPTYEAVVRSFYHGLASLQVGLLDDAKSEFARATGLVPQEPAAWADLGLAQLRLGEFEAAAGAVDRAAALAPRNADIALLQGRLETSRGRIDQAIADFRHAVTLDPQSLRARYALAEQIESSGQADADDQAQRLFNELFALRPDNLAVLLERARLAAKRGDRQLLDDSIDRLAGRTREWPAIAVEQFAALKGAATQPSFSEAARDLAVLRNVLVRVPSYRESLAAIRTPTELIAEPFERFLRLPSPDATPAPPDEALTFSEEPIEPQGATFTALLATTLDGDAAPAIFGLDGREMRRLEAGAAPSPSPLHVAVDATSSPASVAALDWNRDFKTDLAVAGRGGVQLLVQTADSTFTDATSAASSRTPFSADASGVWSADIEMDGDLDLIVGVAGQPPSVLRNNGDSTWQALNPFPTVVGIRAFAWGDLDGDGDPDAAFIDEQGAVHVFANRQGGQFQPMADPPRSGMAVALSVGDVNGDGAIDLVTLDADGSIRRTSFGSGGWTAAHMATWSDMPAAAAPGRFRLLLADIDNNGALDVIASGGGRSAAWLTDATGALHALSSLPAGDIQAVADLNGDGQLDFVSLAGGRAVRLIGRSSRQYHWQTIRPRAQPTAGDQRINSFGIGGEIQVRAGLLTQKQIVSGPVVHFGLGTHPAIDVVRIVWPNGILQADFDARADQTVVTEQRLKGSCPWVFAYDGTGMRFVTDFLWRSPLGLRINAQDTAGVTQTEDWIRIRGDQLAPRDGAYDLRITAELWETHFVDQVSLMAVDHPGDVEVFVDERFAASAPSLAVHALRRPHAVLHAWDQTGRDVTDLVARQDGRYLATFARGPYQGIAEDHFVELDVGDALARDANVWLVANGWIYPTDSSINVAISQGRHPQPRGLSLEALDANGTWRVVADDLGFPAGKNKTILVDLSRVERAGVAHPRRLRLRTNLEIYWDWLAVAKAADGAPLDIARIPPGRAELRYRGFSETDFARRDRPELPRYDRIANVTERWRDLIGYYTRYGDVRELVASIDDRYVIMNAGDELRLSFPARPALRAGWRRDFVLAGDGWVKDGDYNTDFSQTVLPLPEHGHPDYRSPAKGPDLEDDPVYRQHAEDWQTYHTRFVAPRQFLAGLR